MIWEKLTNECGSNCWIFYLETINMWKSAWPWPWAIKHVFSGCYPLTKPEMNWYCSRFCCFLFVFLSSPRLPGSVVLNWVSCNLLIVFIFQFKACSCLFASNFKHGAGVLDALVFIWQPILKLFYAILVVAPQNFILQNNALTNVWIWEQGPQYVCTNFWIFVCTTCSGIQ